MTLAGKTVFITGGSRGIGRSIALRCAQDGANIVIAAKTSEPHPKLEGTIHTVAEEIRQAGGQALPLVTDIRYEDQVQTAVQKAVETFGGIDILVNNASAIQLTGTLETEMKRFDLMMSVNMRATFMTSRLCLPLLEKAKNPHILTLSPPLNMSPRWFRHHCAYTISKYGMSMCVLGMSEEFRKSKIAVNALWPRTAIATAAINMLGGDALMQASRKPEIVADAAYAIINRESSDCTGNFYIDDEVLAEEGVSNLDEYAIQPGTRLAPDFFLD